MKKQTKIIAAITLAIVVGVGGYYGYHKHKLTTRVQASDNMMKDKGINQSNADKDLVDDILKNDADLEYAYIRHNSETIMLNLKFNKGVQDKDKYSKVGKYMDKVRTQYKGKNVNTTIIPNK